MEDLNKNITTADRYIKEISSETETDDKKFLAKINDDDVHNSSIFYLEEL
jgi:hypothetical protein